MPDEPRRPDDPAAETPDTKEPDIKEPPAPKPPMNVREQIKDDLIEEDRFESTDN
jgi:hypothetical protein